MNQSLKKAIKHWDHIAPLVAYPRNKKEFEQLQSHLDELLDIIGGQEKNPLIGLMDVMSNTITAYEAKHYPPPKSTGVDALKYLMEEHSLTQSDLPEIGSQGVVSEVLRGKRKLNLNHMKKLAKRFKVEVATFVDL